MRKSIINSRRRRTRSPRICNPRDFLRLSVIRPRVEV